MREMNKLILIPVILLLLTACGQKGPLFLPEDSSSKAMTEIVVDQPQNPEDKTSEDKALKSIEIQMDTD